MRGPWRGRAGLLDAQERGWWALRCPIAQTTRWSMKPLRVSWVEMKLLNTYKKLNITTHIKSNFSYHIPPAGKSLILTYID